MVKLNVENKKCAVCGWKPKYATSFQQEHKEGRFLGVGKNNKLICNECAFNGKL